MDRPDREPRAKTRNLAARRPSIKYTIDGYVATQQHFLNGLITAAEHETQATDTLRTMDVVWTAYRSAEEGRCLTV